MTSGDDSFLKAMLKGKHRKGAGKRLRNMVAEQEICMYGKLACFCCGESVTINSSTLEHIIPSAKGGKFSLDNLALSHPDCNVKRADSGTPRFCTKTGRIASTNNEGERNGKEDWFVFG